MNRIVDRQEIISLRKKFKNENKKVVFTNGVFDILHSGHVDYLTKAKTFGDILIVGVNSDSSVKRIKGEKRPILTEKERAFIISSLKPVDYVTLFYDDTPQKLIEDVVPDVLIKGADWELDKIVGKEIVEKNGGSVKTIEFVSEQSTSKIINSILEKYNS
jgi:D-glycero-beta-D-manno-heptose 1-phosphate adenylyltransferase